MTENNISVGRRAADLISAFFSPLFIPTYATASVLWGTVLRYIPMSVRLWVLTAIFTLTALMPALFIAFLIRKGHASDAALSKRKERKLPFCMTMLCYLGAIWFMHWVNAPLWLTGFFFGATVVLLIDILITLRWKISAHSSALGGYCGALYWLGRHGLLAGDGMVWLSMAFIILGAVGWARIYLDRHTPAQVLAGAVLAFTVVYFSMFLLNIN